MFWGRSIFGGLVFYARDFGFFFAPLRFAFSDAVRHGASPLWNRSLGCGIPMAADPNNSVFFPATWLSLLRPFSTAVRAGFVSSVFSFPLLVFAGLRGLRLSSFSAASIAAAASVSGPALTLASFPPAGWVAALFLPYLALLARKSPGSRVLAGIVLGVAILAGEPGMAIEMCLLGALFALLSGRNIVSREAAAAALTPVVLGVFVGAPQISGAAGVFLRTVRGAGLPTSSGPAYFSVPPLRALSVLWPGLFGDVMSPDSAGYWGKAFFDSGAPYIYSLAIGTGALLLIPAAARSRLGRRLLLLAGIASIASLGRFLPGGSRLLALPGASSLRYPEKWLFFACLAGFAAAAVGLESLRSGDAGSRRSLFGSAAAVAAASTAAAGVVRLAPGASFRLLLGARIVSPDLAGAMRPILVSITNDFLLVAGCAILVAIAARFLRAPRRVGVAVAVVLLFELFARGFDSLPFAPRSYYDRAPEAARAARGAGGRTYFSGEAQVALDPLRPMRPVVWGLPFAGNNDVDRFSPRRSFFFGLDLSRLSLSDPRKMKLLRLADVRSVSSPAAELPAGLERLVETSPGRVLARLPEGRRLRVVFGARIVPNEAAARAALADPTFDPETEAILEKSAPVLSAEGLGSASTVEAGADREIVDATSSSPAVLIRSETYDPGWSAQIDGRPAGIFPADFAFQGVALPPGRHRLVFRYRNPLVSWAMFVSLATLFGCALVLRKSPQA
ncbi:MAG: hypothetical protein ACRD16_14080 [Thermoanaerobaculia bacterium]